jgi:hypothetical protein
MKVTRRQLRRIIREQLGRGGGRTVIIDAGQGGMADSSPQFGRFTDTNEPVLWSDLGLRDDSWEETDAIRDGLKALGASEVEDHNSDQYSPTWPVFPIDKW